VHKIGHGIVGVTAGTLFFVAASRTTSTGSTTDVVTYHNDVARTGQNLNETSLTPTTVTAATFGKTRLLATDGKVDAQPLFLSSLQVPGVGVRDVVYVATEHDSVYAFDAASGSTLWHVSLLGTGETTSDARGCSQVTPEIGITSTPVIDRSRGPNGVVYVVAMSKTAAGAYIQRLHALDAALGTELLGGPQTVQATFPGTGAGSSGGIVPFDPKQYEERAGLLEINGQIVTVWTRTATSIRTPGGSSPMTPARWRGRAC
jgi:outer membrane protein assembly factor BamB